MENLNEIKELSEDQEKYVKELKMLRQQKTEIEEKIKVVEVFVKNRLLLDENYKFEKCIVVHAKVERDYFDAKTCREENPELDHKYLSKRSFEAIYFKKEAK